MADDEAVYSIELKDETSASAESAASALEKLQKQIKADQDALTAMQRAMRNLQQGTSVNIDQFRSLKAQIDAKKQSIAQAQSAYMALGGGFTSTGKKGQSFKDRLAELAKASQAAPGPVGSLAGQLSKLGGIMRGGAMAAGLIAVAAAFVAIVVAAVAATAALFAYGVASANARRSERLRLEGMARMGAGYKAAAASAKEAQTAIDRVATSSSLPRDKIAGYAAELSKAGLTGGNLEAALGAAAIKGAVLGDEGAKSAIKMAAGIYAAGGSVDKFASNVKAKFGDIAAAQMLDLDVQMAKLKENFSGLFAGLKIDGLLAAISGVTNLFSQSTASGRALRTLFELMFQPLVDGAESALVVVKRFFQSIIIGTLYVTLALLRLQVWWKKTFSEGFFTAAPWEKLGSLIVDGIVSGMNAADEWLMDAIRGLGDKAMQAFKKTLGIASPSRVFTDLGLQIPAGVEQGIEKGTPAAQEAAGNMVGAVGAAGRGGGGGASIEIGSIVIQTNATDAGGIARDIEMELRRVLEGVGFMLGAPA